VTFTLQIYTVKTTPLAPPLARFLQLVRYYSPASKGTILEKIFLHPHLSLVISH